MNRLDSLQALRAIAAAMVVFTHAILTYKEKVEWVNIGYDFGSDIGVKIFFCISGFIIFKSTINLVPSFASTINFSVRRLIRIVPIYWIATLIYALKLTLTGEAPTQQELLFSLFFIPYVNDMGLVQPVLGLGWTLNYEMFFYFTLAIAILLPIRSRAFLVTLFFVSFWLLLNQQTHTPDHPQDAYTFGHQLLATPYLLFFLFGLIIGQLDQWLQKSPFKVMDTKTIPFLVLSVMAFVLLKNFVDLKGGLLLVMELLLAGSLVALCAISVTHVSNEDSKLRRAIILAGDGSYSTYLFHGFVLGPSARIIKLLGIEISPFLFAFMMVIICTLVGTQIFKWVERPLLKKMNHAWRNGAGKRFSHPERASKT